MNDLVQGLGAIFLGLIFFGTLAFEAWTNPNGVLSYLRKTRWSGQFITERGIQVLRYLGLVMTIVLFLLFMLMILVIIMSI